MVMATNTMRTVETAARVGVTFSNASSHICFGSVVVSPLVTNSAIVSSSNDVTKANKNAATSPARINGSVTWNVGTGQMTSFGLGTTHRLDSLPGSIAESRSRDLNADVSRGIKMPERWKLKNDLRTRLSYQQSSAQSWVQNQSATAKRSRLADNGRQAINVNADADVAENLTFSLTGARIVTFDNNLNRRFSQIVFTAVLQVSFFAGELK